jgi:hypothetical protein
LAVVVPQKKSTQTEGSFILHQVLPAGTNVLREPKILMAPPSRLLYRDYEDALDVSPSRV